MSAAVGDSILFHRIIVFLAVYTLIMGVVNLAPSVTMDNLGGAIGGSTVPGQYYAPGSAGSSGGYTEGTNTAEGTILTEIDYTSASAINQNITSLVGGTWTLQSGTGLVLTSVPYFGLLSYMNPSVVVVRNMRVISGQYIFTANVDNIPAGSWYVYPRYISGYSGSDLKVVFASDGIHIKKYPLTYGITDAGDDYFYAYAGANQLSSVTSALTEAVSTDNTNTPSYTATLTISSGGNTLFTTNVRSVLPGVNINDQVRHGGAGSDSTGFVVKSFTDTSVLDNSSVIYSGSTSELTTDNIILGALSGFISLIASALGITGSALLPAWFNALIIAPCSATLIYLQLKMWRGN